MKPITQEILSGVFVSMLASIRQQVHIMDGDILSISFAPSYVTQGEHVKVHMGVDALFCAWDKVKAQGDLYGCQARNESEEHIKLYPLEVYFIHDNVRFYAIGTEANFRPWMAERGIAGLISVAKMSVIE